MDNGSFQNVTTSTVRVWDRIASELMNIFSKQDAPKKETPKEEPTVAKPADQPIVVKPTPPSQPGTSRPLWCYVCFDDFPSPAPGYKTKYCVKHEEDPLKRATLQKALDAQRALPLKEGQRAPEKRMCRTPGCGSIFELRFAGAPDMYCPKCYNAYVLEKYGPPSPQTKAETSPPPKYDANLVPRAQVLAPQILKKSTESQFREALRQSFQEGTLPKNIQLFKRNGEQTIFLIPPEEITFILKGKEVTFLVPEGVEKQRSLTIMIERTPAELAAEEAMRQHAEQARRESEAKAEVERKQRLADQKAVAEAKATSKKHKNKK